MSNISHEEAKELHHLIAGPHGMGILPDQNDLARAIELIDKIVADTEPHPADNVSYAPCIIGKIEIGDETTEFMLGTDAGWNQWGAESHILGQRVDLMDNLSSAWTEWVDEHLCRTCKEELLDDNEGYDGECGNCADKTEGKRSSTCTVCHEEITRDEDDEWVHSDGDKYCGTGDGAMALPEDEDDE